MDGQERAVETVACGRRKNTAQWTDSWIKKLKIKGPRRFIKSHAMKID
jgi:hypothetical protein